MPEKKKAVGLPALPKYVAPKDAAGKLAEVIEILEMLARQSGVAEIRDKVEALKG